MRGRLCQMQNQLAVFRILLRGQRLGTSGMKKGQMGERQVVNQFDGEGDGWRARRDKLTGEGSVRVVGWRRREKVNVEDLLVSTLAGHNCEREGRRVFCWPGPRG